MSAWPRRAPAARGAWVLPYLLERRVVAVGDALAAGASAEDVSVSHQAFLVRLGGMPRFFVKRVDRARSQGRDLVNEATVYQLAAVAPGLASVVPRCVWLDPRRQILVLESVDGVPLGVGGLGNDAAPVLAAYGAALARVHRVRPPRFGEPPWLLRAFEPRWGAYEWLPPACGGLLARLGQSHVFRSGFGRARADWRVESLVHGDIRPANVLMTDTGGAPEVRLLDWELACVGDPAWDLGAVLADCCVDSDGDIASSWRLVRRSTSAFLSGYRQVRQLTRSAWASLLERGARLAGVRLVQTLVECAHVSSSELAAFEARYAGAAAILLHDAPAIGALLREDAG